MPLFTIDRVRPSVARVRLRDGVEFDLATGETVVCDARRPTGDVNVLSHAHGDHLYSGASASVVASSLTAAVAAARGNGDPPELTDHEAVTLLDSGHVAGSRAALVDDGETRFLYTGDVSTRDRAFLSGFEPVPVDVLIVESTYGRPEYVFPPQAEVESAVVDFLDETADRPAGVFGYAFGRVQTAQLLAKRADRDGALYVTDEVARVNEVVEAHLGVTFGAERWTAVATLEPGDVLVRPGSPRSAGVPDLVESSGAVTVGLSGWAQTGAFRYGRGFDAAFPLSDHCDHDELVALVEAVDPEVVYTHHGFAADLATALASRGFEAYALRRNQATLAEF